MTVLSRPLDDEAEAVATTAVVATLRRRLKRLRTLEHPALLGELRMLEEQLAARFEDGGRRPGRHRSPSGKAFGRAEQPHQAGRASLKPDPATAATAADFITALWQFRAWSGDTSWRKMAAHAEQSEWARQPEHGPRPERPRPAERRFVHSTIYKAMHDTTLPKLDVVKVIIAGCGGTEDDVKAFTAAWQRINSASAHGDAGGADRLSTPISALAAPARTGGLGKVDGQVAGPSGPAWPERRPPWPRRRPACPSGDQPGPKATNLPAATR
jgi:hypothetical protein